MIWGDDKEQEVKKAADEWCDVNPGWKFANESRNEHQGEGDAVIEITWFKVESAE